jgi:hypothetical protein
LTGNVMSNQSLNLNVDMAKRNPLHTFAIDKLDLKI